MRWIRTGPLRRGNADLGVLPAGGAPRHAARASPCDRLCLTL